MKKKSKKNKKLLIIVICTIILLGIVVTSIIYNSKEGKRISNISFYVSNDYSYFDVTIEDFYDKLDNKFRKEHGITTKLTNYNENGYQYLISLSSHDIIYVRTRFNNIVEIKFDYTDNKDGGELGIFLAFFVKNSIKNFNDNDYNNIVDFLSDEELFKKERTLYVYKHLLFDMNIKDDYTGTKAYLVLRPVKENNNNEYQERIKAEKEKKKADSIKKEEEKKKKEQAKIEQEEKERKEKIEQKTRFFTAGTYTVGNDIDPGTYNMVAISGRGNCYVHGKSTVIETFTPGGDEFAIDNYKNVSLTYGGTIEVTSTLQIKFEPVA